MRMAVGERSPLACVWVYVYSRSLSEMLSQHHVATVIVCAAADCVCCS